MNLELEVYLDELETINRVVKVNDNLTLQEFCEDIIISMNGNGKHMYQLELNDYKNYLGPGCCVIDYDYEEMMEDLTLEDLDLCEDDVLTLNYDFRHNWNIIITVKEVYEKKSSANFEVIQGNGVGLLEDLPYYIFLEEIADTKLSKDDIEYFKGKVNGVEDYLNSKFDVDEINHRIEEYWNSKKEIVRPRHYIMNVSLEEFGKEIKRKISVDSNVSLDKFCKSIILAMNGDLSHDYCLKKGKECITSDEFSGRDLCLFELKEKQKFKVIYDYGDNWTFNITVSKVNEDYGVKPFTILSGKGYGIIEDCGGSYELSQIFEGNNPDWEEYDINDFDLEKTNRIIDIHY